jgi:hypothetical protein
VVPYAPGTNSDVQTRLATAHMAQTLGQAFVVENRAGAGGSVGAEAVAKARPDGYTLLTGSNGPLAINPALQPRLGYAVNDFAAIGIPNAVAKIGAQRGPGRVGFFHQQYLGAANAKMPVGQSPRQRGMHGDGLGHAIEHDKVVAQSLHLGEFQSAHGLTPALNVPSPASAHRSSPAARSHASGSDP